MKVQCNAIKQELEEKIEMYKESVKQTKNIEKKIQVRNCIDTMSVSTSGLKNRLLRHPYQLATVYLAFDWKCDSLAL